MNILENIRSRLLIGYVWRRFYSSKGLPPLIMMSKNKAIKSNWHKKKTTFDSATAHVNLKVIGCGAKGSPKSIFVETDRINYLFNCGEGTQRLTSEHKCRLPKLQNIFITSTKWENFGGLPGLLLTMQSFQSLSVNVHGAKGTEDILKAIKHFVFLDKIRVQTPMSTTSSTYTDSNMTICYVTLEKAKEEKNSNYKDSEAVNLDFAQFPKSPKSGDEDCGSPARKIQKIENLPSDDLDLPKSLIRVEDVMSFICKLHASPGTLSLEKCIEKGVKPGPDLRLLKEGKDITLPNGTTVLSKDVCSPSIPGAHFAVVDCPSEAYLDSLVNNKAFKEYHQLSQESSASLYCIFHFTKKPILDHPKYRKWMNEFGTQTYHIIVNEENDCISSESVYKNQYRLHSLAPNIFPLLAAPSSTAFVEEQNGCGPIIRGKTLYRVTLKPQKSVHTNDAIKPLEELYETEAQEMALMEESFRAFREKFERESKLLSGRAEFPKIVLLGTGSSMPSKLRNISGILFRIDEKNSIVLDCGEGTYGQLCKLYGKERVKDILSSIKVIYVSHIHADHHLGIISILQNRYAVNPEPVTLLLPERLAQWLQYYNYKFEDIAHYYRYIENQTFLKHSGNKSQSDFIAQILTRAKIKRIETTLVTHCAYAYGVSIYLESGEKIVYSGDTKPCDDLVTIGKNCDLLIHEATMEDGLEQQASYKLHSTISQAIEIGRKMNAKNILLTHFSQRYSKLPYFPDSVADWNNVAVGYDFMECSLSKFRLLCMLSPAYEIMYSEFKEQLAGKAIKRTAKEFV